MTNVKKFIKRSKGINLATAYKDLISELDALGSGQDIINKIAQGYEEFKSKVVADTMKSRLYYTYDIKAFIKKVTGLNLLVLSGDMQIKNIKTTITSLYGDLEPGCINKIYKITDGNVKCLDIHYVAPKLNVKGIEAVIITREVCSYDANHDIRAVQTSSDMLIYIPEFMRNNKINKDALNLIELPEGEELVQ